MFPDKFKIAIVKALYKSGNIENVSNYRPISLLSNLSKLVKFRFIYFVEKNELLSKNQFGFRPGKRTTGAL